MHTKINNQTTIQKLNMDSVAFASTNEIPLPQATEVQKKWGIPCIIRYLYEENIEDEILALLQDDICYTGNRDTQLPVITESQINFQSLNNISLYNSQNNEFGTYTPKETELFISNISQSTTPNINQSNNLSIKQIEANNSDISESSRVNIELNGVANKVDIPMFASMKEPTDDITVQESVIEASKYSEEEIINNLEFIPQHNHINFNNIQSKAFTQYDVEEKSNTEEYVDQEFHTNIDTAEYDSQAYEVTNVGTPCANIYRIAEQDHYSNTIKISIHSAEYDIKNNTSEFDISMVQKKISAINDIIGNRYNNEQYKVEIGTPPCKINTTAEICNNDMTLQQINHCADPNYLTNSNLSENTTDEIY